MIIDFVEKNARTGPYPHAGKGLKKARRASLCGIDRSTVSGRCLLPNARRIRPRYCRRSPRNLRIRPYRPGTVIVWTVVWLPSCVATLLLALFAEYAVDSRIVPEGKLVRLSNGGRMVELLLLMGRA